MLGFLKLTILINFHNNCHNSLNFNNCYCSIKQIIQYSRNSFRIPISIKSNLNYNWRAAGKTDITAKIPEVGVIKSNNNSSTSIALLVMSVCPTALQSISELSNKK